MLQHQENVEPETSEVIRLAQQMYERDRAEQERRSSLMAAAEEVGIPSEYLTKAAAQLKARQITSTPVTSIQAQRSFNPALALALALALGASLLFSLTYIRAEAPAPATAIELPTQTKLEAPMVPPPTPPPAPPGAPTTGGG